MSDTVEGSVRFERVGAFDLLWGESLRWDDRRQRLYFVDCGWRRLHWLDGGEPPLGTLDLPAIPTGVVLAENGTLVVCLDIGLYVVDPDAGSIELLAEYPDGIHGRANDASADPAGNLVTGTLNLAPGPGGYWWFSPEHGWRELDGEIGNANGPVFVTVDGEPTLVFGDTLASAVYAYPYDADSGTVGARRVYADYSSIDGAPDGATADADEGVWGCVLGAGKLAHITPAGVEQLLDVGVPYPSDAAFGGPELDRLFLTSIAVDLGDGPPPAESAWLTVVRGLDVVGRPEQRFVLS